MMQWAQTEIQEIPFKLGGGGGGMGDGGHGQRKNPNLSYCKGSPAME